METIIGVRFKTAGKIYHFSPGQLTIARGQHVIVETARGMECGRVVTGPEEVELAPDAQPLKVIQRIANEHDMQRVEDNRKHEKEARVICKKKIREHKLPMKLVDVEYTFDLNKIIFYFTADGRIDFRDLVKDLASVFRTRIELRQIGVRDEAKMMGGIGCCGRPLCCATFLGDFEPVSIRMAKEQNLSLNPTKISGICGAAFRRGKGIQLSGKTGASPDESRSSGKDFTGRCGGQAGDQRRLFQPYFFRRSGRILFPLHDPPAD